MNDISPVPGEQSVRAVDIGSVSSGLKYRVLVPLALALVALVVAFVSLFIMDARHHLADDTVRTARLVDDLIETKSAKGMQVMAVVIELLMRDRDIEAAFRARDSKALLEISGPILERIRERNRITHFYYILPDQTALLRVHNPGMFGDKIERFVFLEAARTGRPFSGKEQGRSGSFTLRVVHPWIINGELLGYLEMGVEFEEIMEEVHRLADLDVFSVIAKSTVDREDWTQWQGRQGRVFDWDEFPTVAIEGQTMKEVPAPIRTYLSQKSREDFVKRSFELEWRDHVYLAIVVPFSDIRERHIGEFIVLVDNTASVNERRQSVIWVILLGILVGVALIWVFYVFLGRVQKRVLERTVRLADAQQALDVEQFERKRKEEEIALQHERITFLESRAEMVLELERAKRTLEERAGELLRLNETLQQEIVERKRAEADVVQLNDELEEKVMKRTADLEQARRDAEEANRAKSAFLATMSHEIRTPMNGVIGMVDVLQQSSLKRQQMEMVDIIHDSAHGLLKIIDDILDFSKIEAGKFQIDSVPMNVAAVVEGACENLSRVAFRAGVELTLFVDPAIPSALMGDPARLRQVLVNLTNNAVKFSSGELRPGRVSVRAVLIERSNERATFEIRVTDNGIGIDDVTQARLFSPFMQADSSTTRNFGGTGLGLVISRQLVGMMGGEVTLQSEPGSGSIFVVHLCCELAPEQPGEVDAASPVEGLSCLVVQGEDGLADDFVAYLAHGGAQVAQVAEPMAVGTWLTSRPPGKYIVVFDAEGRKLPLDELRAVVRKDQEVRFVVVERGQRRGARSASVDLVLIDGNVLTRSAFLTAVGIAACRVVETVEERPPNIVSTPAPHSREEAKRRGVLILVAEDNLINQKVILRQLSLLGYTADVAVNGREALTCWQSGDYGMLITDLHMPEMDGYELTSAVRAEEASKPGGARIPIIAFTANALKGEAERCRSVGMDDFLSKPVQLDNLKAMLERWLVVDDPEGGWSI